MKSIFVVSNDSKYIGVVPGQAPGFIAQPRDVFKRQIETVFRLKSRGWSYN